MRTLKSQDLVRDENEVLFPHGTIINETDSVEGTPAVRELYGDILTNIYALLDDVGIVPNNLEDSETAGYQLLNALKKLANILNDVEQVMTITGTVASVNFDIDNLPDKYVFVARPTEMYNPALSYTFTGNDSNTYSMVSPMGFNASDVVLCIIDQNQVRVYSLVGQQNEVDVFTVFGTPVQFNDGSKVYYEEEGNLLTDTPTIDYLQSIIRVASSNGTLVVYNIFILQGHALCFCWLPDVQTYVFYQFDLQDLSTAEAVTVEEITIPTGSNEEPYAYTDGSIVYLTNQAGTTANEYELAGLTYDPDAATLNLDVSRVLANTFQKTTNAIIQGNELVTFSNGDLKKYDLTTGIESDLGSYNTLLGVLFRFNGFTYYSNGEVAKKWTV